MVRNIKENGMKLFKDMVEVIKFGKMVVSMKAIGNLIKLMDVVD